MSDSDDEENESSQPNPLAMHIALPPTYFAQQLGGKDVKLILRLLFTPPFLAGDGLNARAYAKRGKTGISPIARGDGARVIRHVAAVHVQPLLFGDVKLTSADRDQRGEGQSRGDSRRGPFDRAGQPWSGLQLSMLPAKSSKPRVAFGFEQRSSAVDAGGGANASSSTTPAGEVTTGGGVSPGLSGVPAGAPYERHDSELTVGDELDAPTPRASLQLGDEWTISCWLQLPLPGDRSDRLRVLAMGLPAQPDAADNGADEGGGKRASPVCHVVLAPPWAGAGKHLYLGVQTEGKGHRSRDQKLCETFDLFALPWGWHHIGCVGQGGETTFYVDGRCVGSVNAQVTTDIVWLGNIAATDGNPCAALGTLCDLRVYADALSAAQVAELSVTAAVPWGGLEVDAVGVWGAAGQPPPPAHTQYEHMAYPEATKGLAPSYVRRNQQPIAAPAEAGSEEEGEDDEDDDDDDDDAGGGDECFDEGGNGWDDTYDDGGDGGAGGAANVQDADAAAAPRKRGRPKGSGRGGQGGRGRGAGSDTARGSERGSGRGRARSGKVAAGSSGAGSSGAGSSDAAAGASHALVAVGGTSTALVQKSPKKARKKATVAMLPLRQPHLDGAEREEVDENRQQMIANGYKSMGPPAIDPAIPPSLHPKEMWSRLRDSGGMKGLHHDTYLLCGLCTEGALLRDPNIKNNPYYVTAGKCPPGFVSVPDFEKHCRAQHCWPIDGPPKPPQARIMPPANADDAPQPGAAAEPAAQPAAQPAANAADANEGGGGAAAGGGGGAAAGGGGGGGEAGGQFALALAGGIRLSARQQMKLLQEQARQAGLEAPSPKDKPAYGVPGTGDGLIGLEVERVQQVSSNRYQVHWRYYDDESEAWRTDVEYDLLSKPQITILRRHEAAEVFEHLDVKPEDDAAGSASPAAAGSASPAATGEVLPPAAPPAAMPAAEASANLNDLEHEDAAVTDDEGADEEGVGTPSAPASGAPSASAVAPAPSPARLPHQPGPWTAAASAAAQANGARLAPLPGSHASGAPSASAAGAPAPPALRPLPPPIAPPIPSPPPVGAPSAPAPEASGGGADGGEDGMDVD